MIILCLCREDNHRKIIPGYAQAFRARGDQFVCVDWAPPFDSSLDKLLQKCPARPDCIFHFESDFPLLPQGLTRSEIPTVTFEIDTYAYTKHRIHWSSLFDHVAVFHPKYDSLFQKAGHPGAFVLPHAVQSKFFEGSEFPREFEVGWVGQTKGVNYRHRQEWIPRLAGSFQMNDWTRNYPLQEVAEIYRRSKLVINIGRDDFPEDANLRVFEVLASGALLLTSLPSELTDLGFKEGVHFVGYRRESDILVLIRQFLQDERARAAIAEAGRIKVFREHTYDSRVVELAERLQLDGTAKLAPARRWSEAQVRGAYLDFFVAHGLLDCAAVQLRQIAGRSLRETLGGTALLGKAWMKRMSSWLGGPQIDRVDK